MSNPPPGQHGPGQLADRQRMSWVLRQYPFSQHACQHRDPLPARQLPRGGLVPGPPGAIGVLAALGGRPVGAPARARSGPARADGAPIRYHRKGGRPAGGLGGVHLRTPACSAPSGLRTSALAGCPGGRSCPGPPVDRARVAVDRRLPGGAGANGRGVRLIVRAGAHCPRGTPAGPAHDVISQRAASLARAGYRTTPSFVDSAWEAEQVGKVDTIVAIQWEDAATLRRTAAQPHVVVAPPAFEPSVRTRPPGRDNSRKICLFVGSGALPNVDGLGWFLERIWPAVHAACPDAEFRVVGTAASQVVGRQPGVTLVGEVDDLGVEYEQASVVVVPLRSGSGLKVKLVEAINEGCPVITTRWELRVSGASNQRRSSRQTPPTGSPGPRSRCSWIQTVASRSRMRPPKRRPASVTQAPTPS